MTARALVTDRRGATALEFAILGSVFMLLTLGTIQVGLLLWTKDTLQSVAALTARCAALASPLCTDASQFAVTLAGNLIFAGVIAKSDLTPAPGLVCSNHSQYFKVTISSGYWATSMTLPPLNNVHLGVVSYHPTGVAC